jgi:uncharacterized protein (DUF433 family)
MATRTDLFPHITSDPAIQGGAAGVTGTRLPVRAVAFYRRETHDRQRILFDYPQLTPTLLDEVIRYYQAHQAEIDAELRAEDDESEAPGAAVARA